MERTNYFINKIQNDYPFVFLDVGAMDGIPLKWRAIADKLKIIAFEPDLREFTKLKNNENIKYLNYALHDKSENLKYYITKGHGRSSIYEPNISILSQYENEERYHVIREEVIPSSRVKSLDDVLEENSIHDADFIKLDTQGSEVLILQGGQKRLLPQIFGAQIEVEFIQLYKGQSLFRDVDEFMQDKGFSLIDLKRSYWKRKDYYAYLGKGELIFGDALYFKRVDFLYEELSDLQDKSYAKSKIFKNILICMVYKMFDYAVAILETGSRLGYLTDSEYKEANSQIKRCAEHHPFLTFSLNRRVYNTMISLLKKFKPLSYLGWADSDNEIGNIKDV